MAASTGGGTGNGDGTTKPWDPGKSPGGVGGGRRPPAISSDQFQKVSPPWWALGEMFPELYDMQRQQGPGFDANGMPDYGYGQGYVDPNAGGFGWEDTWGPMAQQMESQSKAQMARLREEFGTGAAGSARYSSPLMMAQEAGLAQTAADMNQQMSTLQYQDRVAGDQRQRQTMQDMMGMGNAEQANQQAGLDMGYQDWLRRQGWGMDQAGRFVGQNYQPDYLADPNDGNSASGDATEAAWISALGIALGAMMGSDENIKHDIAPVNNAEILERFKALKVQQWKYNGDDALHVGPMAQDFAAQFGLGKSDKMIGMVDAHGVTMAAMQEMLRRLEQLEAERKAA